MSKRTIQVGRQLRKHLTRLLDELRDPEVGELVLTEVELSPDLLFARVFFDTNDDELQVEKTLAALERAKPHLRRRLAAALNLRNTPQLSFHFDKDLRRAEKVRRLIDEVTGEHEGEPEAGEDR